MDEQAAVIQATLYAMTGQLAAYQALCQALIATHPDRRQLLGEFTTAAHQADAAFRKSLDNPAGVRVHLDVACQQIVGALRG